MGLTERSGVAGVEVETCRRGRLLSEQTRASVRAKREAGSGGRRAETGRRWLVAEQIVLNTKILQFMSLQDQYAVPIQGQ